MEPKIRLLINVGDVRRGKTLGVAHFASNLISEVETRPDVQLTLIGANDVVHSYSTGACETIDLESVRSQKAKSNLIRKNDLMLQIHHFLDRPIDVPTMTIVHDLHLFNVAWKYDGGYVALHDRFTDNLTNSQFIVSEFPGTVSALKQRFPELASKIHAIDSPTLLSDYPLTEGCCDQSVIDLRLGDAVPTVLYPAQFQAHKNHWNLLAAIAILRDRCTPVRLILTGSMFRAYMMASIEARVTQLGLEDLVIFAGYVEGDVLRDLYSRVDGVISPSMAEGGAYIAQEAIVHGRPVTCSSLESVQAHLAKLEVQIPLFDPFDVISIADAIWEIVSNGATVVSGSSRAIELEQSWSWQVVVDQLLKIAQQLSTQTT